jgi:hypothetical protein
MNEQRIDNVAGALVFWSFGPGTQLSKLREALTANGFGQHSPERMTDGAALRASLAAEFEGHKVFPVIVEGKTVFEVVKVSAEGNRNNYEHVMTASVNGKQEIETDSYDTKQEERIRESFSGYCTLVPTSQLTNVMVEIVMSLGGVTMRPAGGIYWIPECHWTRWKALADAVEQTGPKNRCDACRVILDENCLKSVREALTAEVNREAATINATLNDPETGKRAASTATNKAQALREKIAQYETAFGIAMTDLSKAMDDATTIEATATLMDVANQMDLFAIAG